MQLQLISNKNSDVDDATMVRVDLERKIETLREELEYNRKVHNEEMEDLKEQISSQDSIIYFQLFFTTFLSGIWDFDGMYQVMTIGSLY